MELSFLIPILGEAVGIKKIPTEFKRFA